jgi:hypothetical protein
MFIYGLCGMQNIGPIPKLALEPSAQVSDLDRAIETAAAKVAHEIRENREKVCSHKEWMPAKNPPGSWRCKFCGKKQVFYP